jgi:hypothetical protein
LCNVYFLGSTKDKRQDESNKIKLLLVKYIWLANVNKQTRHIWAVKIQHFEQKYNGALDQSKLCTYTDAI